MTDEEDAAGGRPEPAVGGDGGSRSSETPDDAGADGSGTDSADANGSDTGGIDADSADTRGTDTDSADTGGTDRSVRDSGVAADADGPADGDGIPDAPAEDDAPADHTTERRSLSPNVQLIWGLGMLVGVVVLTLGATFIAATVDGIPSWGGAAVGALLLIVGVAWVHLRYRLWVYEVRADSLYLERGVFTHVRTIAPYVRIQHVDTQRGPLERWLGLSTLVVFTAGTRGADVSIPGLTAAEARDLQERVKELAIRAEGGDAV